MSVVYDDSVAVEYLINYKPAKRANHQFAPAFLLPLYYTQAIYFIKVL